MIDKNMIALAEIRNGYTLNKYGNLTLEQNSLIKYDNLCLKLIEENQKYKEVIDKAIYYINNNGAKQYNHHDNYRGKWYSPDELDTIVDILKEVE